MPKSLIQDKAAITGIGLALRIAWVLHLDPLVDVFGVPVSDQGWYYQVATNLANGKGFVIQFPSEAMQATAYRPPAYPLLLAGLWRVVGVDATPAKLLNVALGTATIPLVYAVGRQIFDRRVGLISAGVYAVLPSAIVWLALTHSEALFTLLFLAALWLILSMQSEAAGRRRPGAGSARRTSDPNARSGNTTRAGGLVGLGCA
ncbi:MAG: glycosyltransferase family 39 protein [Chloroflexi bacterium]|nr:glycosyltransferase family 39 protein [Chloroflexota bacterium]